jgi:hypothetical protein
MRDFVWSQPQPQEHDIAITAKLAPPGESVIVSCQSSEYMRRKQSARRNRRKHWQLYTRAKRNSREIRESGEQCQTRLTLMRKSRNCRRR